MNTYNINAKASKLSFTDLREKLMVMKNMCSERVIFILIFLTLLLMCAIDR